MYDKDENVIEIGQKKDFSEKDISVRYKTFD